MKSKKPMKWSTEAMEEFIRRVSAGRSLSDVSNDADMPVYQVVMLRCKKDRALAEKYRAAVGDHCKWEGCKKDRHGRSPYCEDHQKANYQASRARERERTKAKHSAEPKPHKKGVNIPKVAVIEQKPVMSEEERMRLDAKQRLYDLQTKDRDDQRIARSLGFEHRPGKPLASKVRHLSKSEIDAIAATLAVPKYQRELSHYNF